MTEPRLDLIAAELERVDGVALGAPSAKHKKMARSPFQFFRGSAQIFYADLASGVAVAPRAFDAAPLTCIQGDCHFSNFGFFTEEGSHSDRVVWAPNDFDDAAKGPASFDLLRFVVSLFLIGDDLRGVSKGRYPSAGAENLLGRAAPSEKDCAAAATAFLRAYRDACAQLEKDENARDRPLDQFPKGHFLARYRDKAAKRTVGGSKFEDKSTVGKLAARTPKGLFFRETDLRLKPLEPALEAELRDVFRPYLDDEILDVVRRIGAGTGSVNVDRFYFLVGPRDEDDPREIMRLAHVVEAKHQREAAMIRHFPEMSPVNRLEPAHLTVDCQRRMMRRPDIVLDELVWRGEHWLLRSRHNARFGVDPEDLFDAKVVGEALSDYAAACGETLALAHARGDRRSTRFETAMKVALKRDEEALVDAGRAYADRVIKDHALMVGALAQ